jgi:hypothetical protein
VPDGVGRDAYATDPPVSWAGPGRCNEEMLVTLHGFRLAAGGLARVWIVVQAARPAGSRSLATWCGTPWEERGTSSWYPRVTRGW